MAVITSAASGDFSAGATWVGGVVPGAADDVVIGAAHVVILDVDATIISLSGAAATNNWLEIQTSRTLTCTGANGITAKSINNGGGLVRTTGVGTTVNIISNIIGVQQNLSYALIIPAICTVNITGNITISGIVNVLTDCIVINTSAILNIVGNIIGSSGANRQSNINATNAAVVNITGNLLSGTGPQGVCFSSPQVVSTVTLNIIGSITNQNSTSVDISPNHIINMTCTGTIIGSGINAIRTPNAFSVITIEGNVINTNGVMAITTHGKLLIKSTASPSWTFQDENNANKTLYSPGAALGNPATTDVRDGVTYADGALTGSLIIPPTSSVAVGVPVDNTRGTAMIDITQMGTLLTSFKIS